MAVRNSVCNCRKSFLTDIIQHPQSSVVTLPATILTATVTGAPGSGITVPPPGVHIPPHSGPLVPPPQTQVTNKQIYRCSYYLLNLILVLL